MTGKNVLRFVLRAAATTTIFGLTLWGLEQLFGGEPRSIAEIAVQSILFGIIFTAWQMWSEKRKARDLPDSDL